MAAERDQGNLVATERDQCTLVSLGRGELVVRGRVGEGNGAKTIGGRLVFRVLQCANMKANGKFITVLVILFPIFSTQLMEYFLVTLSTDRES